MTNFFNKLKITCFGAIFGGPFYQFLVIFFFFFFFLLRKSGSVTHNFMWVFSTMQKHEKTRDKRKRPGRWKDRRNDGRTEPTVQDLSSYQKSNKIYKTSPKNNRNTLILEKLKDVAK